MEEKRLIQSTFTFGLSQLSWQLSLTSLLLYQIFEELYSFLRDAQPNYDIRACKQPTVICICILTVCRVCLGRKTHYSTNIRNQHLKNKLICIKNSLTNLHWQTFHLVVDTYLRLNKRLRQVMRRFLEEMFVDCTKRANKHVKS